MSGLLVRLFERRALENKSSGRDLIDRLRGGYGTDAGVTVTPENALGFSGVWCCTRVLAESISSLPFLVYRRLPGGGKERAVDHPLYSILHDTPNPEMTSSDWRQAFMVNTCLWGNSYNQIVSSKTGRVLELWPMLSRYVELRRDRENQLVYVTSDPGAKTSALPAAEILHIKTMSLNGLVGISPVSQARQAIGLAVATEQFGAHFFANGANPGIVLKHPGVLGDSAYERVKNSWDARSGLEAAHKPVILEEGMSIDKIGIPNNDAQFLETRKFQLRDVCRWFRMQPHLVGDLENATFSNIEHQGIEFVVHTLRPWLAAIEQAVTRSLFTPQERREYYVELLVDALLRGDIQSRYNAYSVARQWGWMSTNDIRGLENMNPVPGGDAYFAPLNMVDLAQFGRAPASASAAGNARRIDMAMAYLYRDAVTRIARRAERDVADAARKYLPRGNEAGFNLWLDRFAADSRAYAEQVLDPIARAHIEAGELRMTDPRRRIARWIDGWLRRELQWIRDTIDAARAAGIDQVDAVDDQAKHYNEKIGEWAQEIALAVAAEEDN